MGFSLVNIHLRVCLVYFDYITEDRLDEVEAPSRVQRESVQRYDVALNHIDTMRDHNAIQIHQLRILVAIMCKFNIIIYIWYFGS